MPGLEPVSVGLVWFLFCSVLRGSCLTPHASLVLAILLPQSPDAGLTCLCNSTELFLMPKVLCQPCLSWPVQKFCSTPLFERTFLSLHVEWLVTLPTRHDWCIVPQPKKQLSCLYGAWAQGSRFLSSVLWLDRGRSGIRARQVICSCVDTLLLGKLSSRPLGESALYLPG